jgi:hypothetical protein
MPIFASNPAALAAAAEPATTITTLPVTLVADMPGSSES